MEVIRLSVDPAVYDAAVHAPDALPELGDLAILVKPEATQQGRPGVCFTFHVRLPNGELATAQAVTTWDNFTRARDLLATMLSREGEP